MHTMLNTVIADDDRSTRTLVKNILAKQFKRQVNVVGEAGDIETALSLVETHQPVIIFLNFQMQGCSGFDLLEKMEGRQAEVVLLKGSDNFATRSFQSNVFGYVTKPVQPGALVEVVEKLFLHFKKRNDREIPRQRILVEHYSGGRKIHKLVVTNIEGFQVLNLDEIIRLEGDKNYTHFILAGKAKKITASKTLGEYEDMLNPFGFFRAHQSTIINLRYVKAYYKGNEEIRMADEALVKISRYRKADFLNRFI